MPFALSEGTACLKPVEPSPMQAIRAAVTNLIKPRARKVRILATIGPASNSPEMIRKLSEAGADAFRINMSHGEQSEKVAQIAAIRALEEEGRPSTILVDLQGPKLRVGNFEGGSAVLQPGQSFGLDRSAQPGNSERVELPRHTQLLFEIHTASRRLLAIAQSRIENGYLFIIHWSLPQLSETAYRQFRNT